MSHYKPYLAYKDSGVEWLGKVPEHWEVKPIKSLANTPGTCFIDGDWIESKDLSESGVRYITTGNVGPGVYKEQGSGYISEEKFNELQCIDVCQGDILVSRLNPPIGRACIVPDLGGRVVTSVDNVIFRPSNEYRSKYVVYRFSAADYFHEMSLLASGATMQRISRSELGNVRIAWPSMNEQRSITDHLDRETVRIDALISKKTRFIELLREKRQALITHAVTKGLDPNVKMKESGVEWLGEVPEHWSVTHIKRLVSSISQGWSPECEARSPEEGEWGVLKVGCVNGGQFRVEESKALPNSLEPRPELSVREGDVLVSRANTRELVGSCAVVPRNFPQIMLCDKLYRLIAEPRRVLPEFLAALIAVHGRRMVEIEATGASSSMVNIAQSVIMDLPVAVPQVTEQRVIVTHLQSSAIKLDRVVTRTERSIELLKERRSALITAAVTGQIDLREAA